MPESTSVQDTSQSGLANNRTSLRMERPEVCASQPEISRFQFNLLKDQLGAMTKDLSKVQQEMSILRIDTDSSLKARERREGELNKNVGELRETITFQVDELSHEMRELKRIQSEESEELRSLVQQMQRTMEEELKRLCVAADANAWHLDVLQGAVDRESAERNAAHESLSAKCQEALESRTRVLSLQVNDLQKAAKTQSDGEVPSSAEVADLIARHRDELSAKIGSVSSQVEQVIGEQRDTLTSYEDAFMKRVSEEEQQREQDVRCLSAEIKASRSALEQMLDQVSESMGEVRSRLDTRAPEQTAEETGHELQAELEVLDARVRREIAQVTADQAANYNVLRDMITQHKAGLERHQAVLEDSLAHQRTLIESQLQQQITNLSRENMALQEQISRLAGEQEGSRAEIRGFISEARARTPESKPSSNQQGELDASHATLCDVNREVAVSDGMRLGALADRIDEVERRIQAEQTESRNAMRNVVYAVTSLDGRLREEFEIVSKDLKAGQMMIQGNIEGKVKEQEARQTALCGALADERRARESVARSLQEVVDKVEDRLQSNVLIPTMSREAGDPAWQRCPARRDCATDCFASHAALSPAGEGTPLTRSEAQAPAPAPPTSACQVSPPGQDPCRSTGRLSVRSVSPSRNRVRHSMELGTPPYGRYPDVGSCRPHGVTVLPPQVSSTLGTGTPIPPGVQVTSAGTPRVQRMSSLPLARCQGSVTGLQAAPIVRTSRGSSSPCSSNPSAATLPSSSPGIIAAAIGGTAVPLTPRTPSAWAPMTKPC